MTLQVLTAKKLKCYCKHTDELIESDILGLKHESETNQGSVNFSISLTQLLAKQLAYMQYTWGSHQAEAN